MYQIVLHHIEHGTPHEVPPPKEIALVKAAKAVAARVKNGNGHTNGNGNGNGHRNGTISVGATRHLHVCVNPDAPEEEQVVERFQWGADVPWDQVRRETRALLDARHGPAQRTHHEPGEEL